MLPFKTHRNWEDNPYAEVFIVLQLVYLFYSAKQIQHGYPQKATRVQKKMVENISTYGYYSDMVWLSRITER